MSGAKMSYTDLVSHLRVLGILLAFVLYGCGGINPTASVPAHQIALPKTEYFGVVWLLDNRLVLNYKDDQEPYQKHLIISQLDGTQITKLPQLTDSNCAAVETILYGLLPNGQVQIGKHCYPFRPPKGRGILDEKMYLLSYDPSSNQLTPLMTNSVYTPAMRLPIAQTTWNPTMDRGMFGTGGGLYDSIVWLTRDGYEDAPITIQDSTHKWRLDELFHGDLGHPSPTLGDASWPAWSPDGKIIAFFAAPQTIGMDGFSRLDAPWNLYRMDPVEQKPQVILNDIKHPRSLLWSPDGKWLAFAGERDFGQKGLWIFDPSAMILKQVTDKYTAYGLAWSPNGRQIVGIYNPDESQRHTEVWFFDVSSLLEGK